MCLHIPWRKLFSIHDANFYDLCKHLSAYISLFQDSCLGDDKTTWSKEHGFFACTTLTLFLYEQALVFGFLQQTTGERHAFQQNAYKGLRKNFVMMVQMVTKALTRTEEKLLLALKDTNTVALAAQKIGLKPKTCYNVLFRLRKKYYKARRLVNAIEPLRGHYENILMVLTDRRAEAYEKKQPEKPIRDGTEFTEDQTEEKWQEA